MGRKALGFWTLRAKGMPYRVKTCEQAPISDERSTFHDLHVHETSAWPEIPLASPSRAHHVLYQLSSQGRSSRLADWSRPALRAGSISLTK